MILPNMLALYFMLSGTCYAQNYASIIGWCLVSGTFLKSIMMTTGELDFNDNFIERNIFYPFLYGFWIVFVIVMPVLFNNLLV